MRQYLYAAIGLGLVGCGSEQPSFVEKPVFAVNFTVEGEEGGAGDTTQEPLPPETDVDAILESLEDGASGDATVEDTSEQAGGGGSGASTGTDGTPSPGAGDDWVTPDFSHPSSGEMKACARIAGVAESRLKVAGSQKDVTVSATDILVAKITGNQNRLALNFRGEAGMRLAGICVFLAGNQAEVEIKSNLIIGRILYTARGNQSTGLIVAEEAGNVEEMIVDLGGNGASLNVAGVASCPAPRLKGNSASFKCVPR